MVIVNHYNVDFSQWKEGTDGIERRKNGWGQNLTKKPCQEYVKKLS
jgi:hypothetical protein